MPTYTTTADVRRICGIGNDLISDSDVDDTIDDIEKDVDRFLNTTFQPKGVIEVRDGTGTNSLFLNHLPILTLEALSIDGTAITLTNVYIYREKGELVLSTSAEETRFANSERQQIVATYTYGEMEETSTETTTSNDEVAGTGQTVEVVSGTGFADNDYVAIYGTDGYYEVSQISSGGGTTNLVMDLYFPHAAGSKVVKLQVPHIIQRLTGILAGLALVAREVGQSYKDVVGYTVNDAVSIQKGEPYTQWRQTAIELAKEKDDIMSRLKIKSTH